MPTVPFPYVIAQEGKFFVATCPTLDVASQGYTRDEAIENLEDAILLYLKYKKGVKISARNISTGFIQIPEGKIHDKASNTLAT